MAAHTNSIVQYYYDRVDKKYSCGYCKKQDSYERNGMWAHYLTVEDYQNLIDRGWRRSGRYCYKPVNDKTCCPMYTIRCDALDFQLSKSQKKIVKKLAKFLKDGEFKKYDADDHSENNKFYKPTEIVDADFPDVELAEHAQLAGNIDLHAEPMLIDKNCEKRVSNANSTGAGDERDNAHVLSPIQAKKKRCSCVKPSDSSMPIKKKLMRIERARSRLLAKGMSLEEIEDFYRKKKEPSRPKSFEEILASVQDGKNKLEIKLVRYSSDEFLETIDESYELFKKYQKIVHKDKPEDRDKQSFINFLGQSPLIHRKGKNGPSCGYGSFHQHYRINGKLIAIGVIDILPRCVSSVYLFYDPEYSFLTLGTFSSLVEVKLVRELYKEAPDLKYYYMGYYIHEIPKMRYKAKIRPSRLLCPETYTWHEIDKCLVKLDESKYSRLNDDIDALDEDGIITAEDIDKVRVFCRGQRLYSELRNARLKHGKEDDIDEVKRYTELVGKKCAHNMFLYRG